MRDLTTRQLEILDVVKSAGSTTADALAERLNVSAQTIRREIAILHDARLIARFHGGISQAQNGVRTSQEHRRIENRTLKQAMAEAAVGHLADGMTLFLGTGTTMGELAREIATLPGLRVFTCNVLTAAALVDRPGVDLYIIGGHVTGSEGNVVGRAVLDQIEHLRFDIAFVSCSAFDDDGTPMDFEVDHYPVKRKIIANARKVIMLADHSKFARRATIRVEPLEDLDVLITTATPPDHVARAMSAAGVQMQIIDASDPQ